MTAMLRLVALLTLLATSAAAQTAPQPRAEPEWYDSATAFTPDGYVAGASFHIDSTDAKAPTGYIAVYPKGANDPKTPASAFDAGHMLAATLTRTDGKLTVVSGEFRLRDTGLASNIPREISAARDETDYAALHADMLSKAKSLPAGTMPCDLHGWSNDKDPKGLNVRAEPTAKSKVLGTLPPPYKFKTKSENALPADG